MEFHALLDFIKTRMRMAHIYQPVMIRTLLDHRGEADDEQIAKNLLSEDSSVALQVLSFPLADILDLGSDLLDGLLPTLGEGCLPEEYDDSIHRFPVPKVLTEPVLQKAQDIPNI